MGAACNNFRKSNGLTYMCPLLSMHPSKKAWDVLDQHFRIQLTSKHTYTKMATGQSRVVETLKTGTGLNSNKTVA